jgi:ABC-2 type transport system permease protein
VASTASAFALARRRDAGAGLVPLRPGRPTAGRLLTGPLGLAWRLERGNLAGWSAGFGAAGLAIGVVGKGIGHLLGSGGGGIERVLDRIAGHPGLTDAYLGACTSLLALVAAAYATAAVLRLRTSETDGLAEPVLASPVGRYRWSGSQLLTTALGTAIILLAGGLGMGLGFGLASGGLGGWVSRLIEAALVQLPAVLCLAGVTCLAFGLRPRWSGGFGWTAVAVCALIGLIGPAVQLTQGVQDISPFAHVPKLPGGVVSATPVAWLCVAALALAAAGAAALRRRDIG